MIIPDANLLLYAHDTRAKFHQKAKEWWEATLGGDELVGLASVTVFAFLRIGTNPRVYVNPMSVEDAIRYVKSWLSLPGVRLLESNYVFRTLALLEEIGTGGNLVSDAQLAAMAIEEGAILHTSDVDFRRFKGLKTFYPLES